MTKGPKAYVLTCTPTYTGDVCSEFANSLAVASAHCVLRNVWLEPRFAPGFSLVEYGRNWLVAKFLEQKNATHLFWVDSDLFFPPDAIYRLLARDKDVICGVYPTKSDTNSIYPYTALGPVVDGLQEAERVPGGFLCMKRHCVEEVVKTCAWHEITCQGDDGGMILAPRFFDLCLNGKELVGEDFIACARLRQAGFKIWVETDINFKHFGRKAWLGNLSKQLKAEEEAGFEGQGSPSAWEKNSKTVVETK
jgi:hypothetical protein